MVSSRTRRHWRRAFGFTLIEMLIVICVIATLAILVIPHLMGAQRRAKEAQLSGDLEIMRNAIERFEASTGAWPPALIDVVARNGAAISADMDGRGGGVDRGGYDGPYLAFPDGRLPKDPFTETDDWVYNNATGELHSNSALRALDGTSYNTW